MVEATVMQEDDADQLISLAEAAERLKVSEAHVDKLVSEGLLVIEVVAATRSVRIDSLQRLVRTMPPSLWQKIAAHSWAIVQEILPGVTDEVRQRFSQNLGPMLDRAEQTVQLLEQLHSKYERGIDVFEDHRGAVAAFIIYAREISLLYSMIALLRSAVPAEALLLGRPIWEAALLARYFYESDCRNENPGDVKTWFEKDRSPAPADVRNYLAKTLAWPIESLRQMYNLYSKPIHLTYEVIMGSYRTISQSGAGGNFVKRMGFDYHKSSIMRDVVELYFVLEQLLLTALTHFLKMFPNVLPMTEAEILRLQEEVAFFRQDTSARIGAALTSYQEVPAGDPK